MGAESWTHMTPYIFAGVAALCLFAVGALLGRRRHGAPDFISDRAGRSSMMGLMDAAKAVYDLAKREQMVIAVVAEQRDDNDPVGWFARSIAGVVHLYKASQPSGYEKVPASALDTTPGLYIQKRDFQTYVRWARTMQ